MLKDNNTIKSETTKTLTNLLLNYFKNQKANLETKFLKLHNILCTLLPVPLTVYDYASIGKILQLNKDYAIKHNELKTDIERELIKSIKSTQNTLIRARKNNFYIFLCISKIYKNYRVKLNQHMGSNIIRLPIHDISSLETEFNSGAFQYYRNELAFQKYEDDYINMVNQIEDIQNTEKYLRVRSELFIRELDPISKYLQAKIDQFKLALANRDFETPKEEYILIRNLILYDRKKKILYDEFEAKHPYSGETDAKLFNEYLVFRKSLHDHDDNVLKKMRNDSGIDDDKDDDIILPKFQPNLDS